LGVDPGTTFQIADLPLNNTNTASTIVSESALLCVSHEYN